MFLDPPDSGFVNKIKWVDPGSDISRHRGPTMAQSCNFLA